MGEESGPDTGAEPKIDRRTVLAAGALALLASPFAGIALSSSRPGPARAAETDPALHGSWTAPFQMGTGSAIHAMLTHTGDVIFFGRTKGATGVDRRSYAATWNHQTGQVTDIPLTYDRDLYCSSHNILSDGRVFIAGGHDHLVGPYGVTDTDIWDPVARRFTPGPKMREARWYPTSVQLANNRVLIFGGQIDSSTMANTVEEYNPATGTMRTLASTATRDVGLYPAMHLLPNGTIVDTNPRATTIKFAPGTQSWSDVATMALGQRLRGTSILLMGGTQVLTFGGQVTNKSLPTPTAEILDATTKLPRWRATGSLTHARQLATAVLLPDGTVLAVGGGVTQPYSGPVLTPELFDPATEKWTPMAPQVAGRMYHALSMLLPDGRVLSLGQTYGPYANYGEIYSPPYLFRGPRPTITSAPATARYGIQTSVATPEAADISRVVLVRPGSGTHQIDPDQRAIPLAFTAGTGSLTFTVPKKKSLIPPGYYMLFILNRAKVPSVAKWVRVY